MEAFQLARVEEALAQIEATPRGHVYASRRGVYAATWPDAKPGKLRPPRVGFRRDAAGFVRAEFHDPYAVDGRFAPLETNTLPRALRARVARMLDNL